MIITENALKYLFVCCKFIPVCSRYTWNQIFIENKCLEYFEDEVIPNATLEWQRERLIAYYEHQRVF